jgi:hypothetical protein
MMLEEEDLDVILHIDEAIAPLARGQDIIGRIIDMVPLSLPASDRQGIMEPGNDSYPFLKGHILYVSPRYQGKEWGFFQANNEIVVNVSLLSSEKKVLARGIGTLRRVKRPAEISSAFLAFP